MTKMLLVLSAAPPVATFHVRGCGAAGDGARKHAATEK